MASISTCDLVGEFSPERVWGERRVVVPEKFSVSSLENPYL